MNVFKRPRQAVLNSLPLNETILVFVDDFRDDFLQPVSRIFVTIFRQQFSKVIAL